MAVKIEVGRMYELNNGDVHECVRMSGGDPTAVDEYGFGPFFIENIGLYHQDGRFADCDLDHDLSVKREVLTIEAGKYYRTRDGRKVGPMEKEIDGDFMAVHPDMGGRVTASWKPNGERWSKEPNLDLIAEWAEPTRDPELTSPYGDNNHPLPDVTRASDTPKTWGEMTDAERKDISFDAMSGKNIELGGYFGWQTWDQTTPLCETHQPIRIKPEPKRETVTCWWGDWGFTLGNKSCRDTHRITFTTTDGKPDLDSIKMEALG